MKKNLKWIMLSVAAAFVLAGTAWADTLILRDGTSYRGQFVSGTPTTITFQEDSGAMHRFSRQEVQSLEFTPESAQTAANQNNSGSYNNGVTSNTSGVTQNTGAAQNSTAAQNSSYGTRANANTVVIPSGTDLSIRTNEAIDSRTAQNGQTFSATVDQDVPGANGVVVIPHGSDAELVLRNVSSNELALDLQSVTVNGRRYTVSTADVAQKNNKGIGANKRTAEMVGGGAILGTLLGAIAGGGKGAAIGAAAGAAAGGVTQVITKGSQVRVPAETVLQFRLDQPLHLQSAG